MFHGNFTYRYSHLPSGLPIDDAECPPKAWISQLKIPHFYFYKFEKSFFELVKIKVRNFQLRNPHNSRIVELLAIIPFELKYRC